MRRVLREQCKMLRVRKKKKLRSLREPFTRAECAW
jgi:hypothetical protein